MNEIREDLYITSIDGVKEALPEKINCTYCVSQQRISKEKANQLDSEYRFHPFKSGAIGRNGHEGSYERFCNVVESIINKIQDGETVLVHCHAGESRSAAIVIACVGHLSDIGYEEAKSRVSQERDINPVTRFRYYCKRYLEEAIGEEMDLSDGEERVRKWHDKEG